MRKNLLLAAVMLLTATGTYAQKNYKMGNPNDPNYSYLKDYGPLKSYIDREKYPNFKLGVGTTVANYLSDSKALQTLNTYYRKHTYAGVAKGLGADLAGIGNISANENANAPKGIYTLTGIRIADGKDINTLPAGIYIVNGKKINKTR